MKVQWNDSLCFYSMTNCVVSLAQASWTLSTVAGASRIKKNQINIDRMQFTGNLTQTA